MLREVIKRLPFSTAGVRAFRNARAARARRRRPIILMYHRIAEDSFDPWGLAVSRERFAGQLEWLSENRTVLALPEFAAKHRDGSLSDSAVALTFDDAYACTAEVAVPLLRKLRMPASIFLPAQLIERGEPFWWDELESLVLGCEADSLRVDGQVVRLGDRRPADVDWPPHTPPRTPRQSAFHQIWAMLRTRKPAEIDESMRQLRTEAAVTAAVGLKRPMRPEEVRSAAADALIDFGSHALTHPLLPTLSAKEKAREIDESVERCAALSGKSPRTFAYPYGDSDEESERLVEKAGFSCACTNDQLPVTPTSRLFALPRIAVGDWDARGLARALGSR